MTDQDKHFPAITAEDRIAQTRALARAVVGSDPEQALETILAAPSPAAVVHAIPEQDFHLLVHDLGPDNAVELLGLATRNQWQYLLDVETWRKDSLDPATTIQWLARLYNAAPARVAQWLLDDQSELLELLLQDEVDILVREPDDDGMEVPDEAFSDDDTFYVSVRPQSDLSDADANDRDQFLGSLLRRISQIDHVKYQALMLETRVILPAEAEEEAYRQRTIRMAEKGFFPFEEAVGLYQPIGVDRLIAATPKTLPTASDETWDGLSKSVGHLFPEDHALVKAVPLTTHPAIEAELVTLCNQLAVADGRVIRDRAQLTGVVEKVAGFLTIGMEVLNNGRPVPQTDAAQWVRRYRLIDLFRLGYGQAAAQRQRVLAWQKTAWFSRAGFSLPFWDERGMGVLGGLLLPRPKCFDPTAAAGSYRDFRTLADIADAAATADGCMAVDALLADMAPALLPVPAYGFVTYKSLLVTLWARQTLALVGPAAPLTMDQVRTFMAGLWTTDLHPHAIADATREAFLSFLATTSNRTTEAIAAEVGSILESLFQDLIEEYGNVSIKNLDPRFINLVLVEQPISDFQI